MKFAIFFVGLVFILVGCSDSTVEVDTSKTAFELELINNEPQVGFFSPTRVNDGFASKVDILQYNFNGPEQLEINLQRASEQGLKLFVVAGLPSKSSKDITLNYRFKGNLYEKQLAPFEPIKLHRALSLSECAEYLTPYLKIMQKYPDAVEAIFLSDEPYLNGVSFQDLDQMALDVRSLLDTYNLQQVKIGAVFASAMFNADFAQHIEAASSAYAHGIDQYFLSLKAKKAKSEAAAEELQWLDIINDVRLTTYDKANNMYLGGGLPESIDIVGFDFYFSTLLQDAVHDQSLQWFAQQKTHPACVGFENTKITELRQALSFWDAEDKRTDDLVLLAKQAVKDKSILEQWYTCRTESTLILLQNEINQSARQNREILFVSESSTNGVMAFDKYGNMLLNQQMNLTHQRVVDEVSRAFNLVKKYPVDHLLFFTYENQFDKSINLNIGGAEGIPEALHLIYQNARRNHESLSTN